LGQYPVSVNSPTELDPFGARGAGEEQCGQYEQKALRGFGEAERLIHGGGVGVKGIDRRCTS
jgi:hypothetical protein